jgi:hypothetical protein
MKVYIMLDYVENWRNKMIQYLIMDFTEVTDTQGFKDHSRTKYYVVSEEELWRYINKAYTDHSFSIAVYKLSECVLDWS